MFAIVLTVKRDYFLRQNNRLIFVIEMHCEVRIEFNIFRLGIFILLYCGT
jgi:hypothetical protein